jgi:hypothetical protein
VTPKLETNHIVKSCSGYCHRCNKEHYLTEGIARRHCLDLMNELEKNKRVDLLCEEAKADHRFSTDYLFGKARGQMFGVMVCRDQKGAETVRRAFSGQYNGFWNIAGWVPPLLSTEKFDDLVFDKDKKIKALGKQIALLPVDASRVPVLKKKRKILSQKLMQDIHRLYRVNNFSGETCSLPDAFSEGRGIPTGTGDCCAPKLLNYAAQNGLTPLGLAEFYWGKENKSGTRKHGRFYPSCEDKCRPILGFMLCGLGK